MNAALQFTGVVKRYGRLRALDGLDLDVPRGSIFGFVGSNGAGKTTSMALAAGLLHANGGTVNLLGDGPFDPARHAGRVTILPQASRLPPYARAAELLTFYGRLQGIAEADLAREVDEVIDWVHLGERRDSAVRTLSHGMARRLGIAQAFLGRPELVLLDEPLNGLDPREAARVRELIRGRRGRQTIVLSSHQLGDIEAVCDTVAFIEKGRRVRQDALDAIVRRRHELRYALAGGAAVPMEQLRAALPEVTWEWQAEGRELRAAFGAPLEAEAVNARALPVLLAAGVGVLEVRRGSDLETEYLSASSAG